jgi:3,4-dihydroxy 2-butanone 4-phosphate synthase/GTP cyclohydrolase II
VPLEVTANTHNLRYLRSKRDRMGHDLPGLPWYDDDVSWASLAAGDDGRAPETAERAEGS